MQTACQSESQEEFGRPRVQTIFDAQVTFLKTGDGRLRRTRIPQPADGWPVASRDSGLHIRIDYIRFQMGFGVAQDISSGHRQVDLCVEHFSLPCLLRISPATAGAGSSEIVLLSEIHDEWFFQPVGQKTYIIELCAMYVRMDITSKTWGLLGI
jgi:hypothetical protein